MPFGVTIRNFLSSVVARDVLGSDAPRKMVSSALTVPVVPSVATVSTLLMAAHSSTKELFSDILFSTSSGVEKRKHACNNSLYKKERGKCFLFSKVVVVYFFTETMYRYMCI